MPLLTEKKLRGLAEAFNVLMEKHMPRGAENIVLKTDTPPESPGFFGLLVTFPRSNPEKKADLSAFACNVTAENILAAITSFMSSMEEDMKRGERIPYV